MSGRVVFALTEAQAAALVLFSCRGGHQLIRPQDVPCDVRARHKTFSALVERGYVAADALATTGWSLTPAGHEVAAVARRLANAGEVGGWDYRGTSLCAP